MEEQRERRTLKRVGCLIDDYDGVDDCVAAACGDSGLCSAHCGRGGGRFEWRGGRGLRDLSGERRGDRGAGHCGGYSLRDRAARGGCGCWNVGRR